VLIWTCLLIVHGLLAVALLGAITHQAVAIAMPVRQPAGGFVSRLRAVRSMSYANAVVVLYVLTAIMGAWIYSEYRTYIRIQLEQLQFWKTHGAFEMKEHFMASCLLVLLETPREPGHRPQAQMADHAACLHRMVQLPGRPRSQ
jgi:hypothetical protein